MGSSEVPTHTKYNEKMLARPFFWGCACIFFYISWSLTACGKGEGDAIQSDISELTYTSLTTGIETLISDSGVTKYKVLAESWYTYDEPEEYWYFPDGIYLEQFDTLYTVEASIKADTAYYYRVKQLWELKGNVFVLNREGQKFSGETLYWDESSTEIYSHDPIRIERSSGQLIQSEFGFRSNQTMTSYELYSSSGHIDVEDTPSTPGDSISTLPTDSLAPAGSPKDSIPK